MRLALAAAAVAVLLLPAAADARHHGHCDAACIARSQRHYKLRVIRPYVPWLRSTGACESGTDGNLHHGLRAVGGGGAFRGRYQFSTGTWYAAGGRGDPAAASWLEQAYRAVRWRRIIGNPHTTAGWPVCG